MNKENLKALFMRYEEARKKHDSFVSQFFTSVRDGQITKEATRAFSPADFEIIDALKDASDEASNAYKKALDAWNPVENTPSK